MKSIPSILLCCSLILSCWPALAVPGISDPFRARVQMVLRERLARTEAPARLEAHGSPIVAVTDLTEFYLRHFCQPAWSWRGRPTAAVQELVAEIRLAGAEGLVPEHYHLPAIEALLEILADTQVGSRWAVAALADLDLLLTDAFLILGSHYMGGRINPAAVDPEWHAMGRAGDLVAVLEEGLRLGGIGTALRGLLPGRSEYDGLRSALAQYRQIAADGGWQPIPAGPILRRGAVGPRVLALASRLSSTGDFAGTATERFDADLEEAIRRFQVRHGLHADGVAGKTTLAALNVPAAERVRQIEVNLERWRWLPQSLGERYLLVNIADFSLRLIEEGETLLDMRVVVGRPYRRTPVFSGQMTYVVLNPYWELPDTVIFKDILPRVRRDPSHLMDMNIRVLQGWGDNAREVDPMSVDWSTLGRHRFPYRLRQDPGPNNSLGRIKFMFPNYYEIYLHDTPARELFRKEKRTFSSGCIRIEKPLELAEYLLQGTQLGSRPALEGALAQHQGLLVHLPKPIPVHLLYWTAWVDRQGILHLRSDIYGRDEVLRLALDQSPPEAAPRIAAPPASFGSAGG